MKGELRNGSLSDQELQFQQQKCAWLSTIDARHEGVKKY